MKSTESEIPKKIHNLKKNWVGAGGRQLNSNNKFNEETDKNKKYYVASTSSLTMYSRREKKGKNKYLGRVASNFTFQPIKELDTFHGL